MKHKDLFLKAANLFARLAGAGENALPGPTLDGHFKPQDATDTVEAIQQSMDDGAELGDQVVMLRVAYEQYLADTCCSLADIIAHMRRGDIIMKFTRHNVLDRLIMEGPLDRIYKRTVRKRKKEIKEAFQTLADEQKPPDPEAAKILEANIWDLVGPEEG